MKEKGVWVNIHKYAKLTSRTQLDQSTQWSDREIKELKQKLEYRDRSYRKVIDRLIEQVRQNRINRLKKN